jgi:RNA polymerase sigma factor (sigma-70 family)
MNQELNTYFLQHYVDGLRNGDPAATDALLRGCSGRLERLARKMLHGFPVVAQNAQTGDILSLALVRLLRALENVKPDSTTHFYNLAATQMRRELLDLAKRYRGVRAQMLSLDASSPDDRLASREPADSRKPEGALDEFEKWEALHKAVEELPENEREILNLRFYHGWDQQQIAEKLDVTVRTVHRWSANAYGRLKERLGDKIPSL